MIVTVFDTETTGLPGSNHLDANNVHVWPHILQFSYIVYDTETDELREFQDVIVSIQSSIPISEESIQIHGITRDKIMKEGQNLIPHLINFLSWCEKSDLIVGHNVEFDFKMVCAELMRQGNMQTSLETFQKNSKFFCTMKSTTQLCQINAVSKTGKRYLKFPSLTELHQFLFKRDLQNMHNAMNDVLICFRCFYQLQFNVDIVEKNPIFYVLLFNLLKIQ
jgi:DNA polymerase III epsilon subunit-like protein